MYYPKSQIKTNLYTNGGEFTNPITNQPYQGYYYETSNGQSYTGKNPQDGPNILLSFQEENLTFDITNVLDNPDFDNTIYYYNTADINYNFITNTNTNKVRYIPKFNATLPTTQDQQLGAFTRYFSKKNNELKYMEINKETYTQLNSKDPKIAWDLYSAQLISWQIQGTKETVYRANKSSVTLIEQNQKWHGFSQYFKEQFSKYYLES